MPLTLTDADIRPISDLRNRFSEISDFVQGGKTVILTKNGYGYMVAMSFDAYKSWADPVVSELNRADDLCETDDRHYTREESLKICRIVPMLGEENYALDIRVGGNVMEVRWFRYARSVRPLT